MKRQNDAKIVISAMSGISPIGLSIDQTCASIRAGITRFEEHVHLKCSGMDPKWDEEKPLVASTVPSLDPYLDSPERLFQLIIQPLTDIFSIAKIKRKEVQSCALLLALPQFDEATKLWVLEKTFFPELFRRTGLDSYKKYIPDQSGHTGVFCLMNKALTMLHNKDVDMCIVGGVDSYLLEERVQLLDSSMRLKSTKSPNGFIPGEAAVVLLLETIDNANKNRRSCLGRVSFIETGIEPRTIITKENSSGFGLCKAIKNVLDQRVDKKDISWILCDLNGENYRGFEWGLVQTKLHNYLSEIKNVNHPADCLGDIGAATGGMLMANAVWAFVRGFNISDEALLWTSSDDGLRAALCMNKC